MAIILINLLVGPPTFRWALVRMGETRGPAVVGVALGAVVSMGGGGANGSGGGKAGEGLGVGERSGSDASLTHSQ